MTEVQVSIAQMAVRKGNPRANWTKMQQLAQAAKNQGGHIVVFPELWDAGFALQQAKDFASPINGGLFAQLGVLSKQLGVYITGSMLEKRGLGVYNSAPLVSPDRGILGAYRKIHLFPLMQEDLYLTAGESTLTVTMPWGPTSMAICYDLRFPELFRRYALEGTKLVIVPCEWPDPRREHYRTLVKARAIENGIYIVAVNRVGVDVDKQDNGTEIQTSYFGHSMVVDPWGELVVEAGSIETVFTVPLDLDLVDTAQRHITVLDDRRPDLYGNH